MVMNVWTARTASSSTMAPRSRPPPLLLRLVEEAPALEQLCSLFGGDFDVPGCQEKNLVGDALHAAVERVRQPAGEVDETLRQLGVGALQIGDDGHSLLETVGDLLR